MLGQRKKSHKDENHQQKKKWELEFAEDEELKIDKDALDIRDIPKQESEDEINSKGLDSIENIQKGINLIVYLIIFHQKFNKEQKISTNKEEKNVSGEKKKKIYEWMDSSDELSSTIF